MLDFEKSMGTKGRRNKVLIIEDDRDFLTTCMETLMSKPREWEHAQGLEAKFVPITYCEDAEDLLEYCETEGRISDIIFAIVDLCIPFSRRMKEANPLNGYNIIKELRRHGIPLCVLTGELGEYEVRERMDVHYISKKKFTEYENVYTLFQQIINSSAIGIKENLQEQIVEIKNPYLLEDTKPLAYASKEMQRIYAAINREKKYKAIFLSGEMGVEFEQLAWAFYERISKEFDIMQFISLDCGISTDETKVKSLLESPETIGVNTIYFLKNVHSLEISVLKNLTNNLTTIASNNKRFVLTGIQSELKAKENSWVEITSQFSMANDHFQHFEIPSLSSDRHEDVEAYVLYYLARDKERIRKIHPAALKRISHRPFQNNVKGLVRTIETLIKKSEDVITLVDLFKLDNIERTLLDHILECSNSDELESVCDDFLRSKIKKDNNLTAEENELVNDLKQIKKIIRFLKQPHPPELIIEEFNGDGQRIWPLERYPLARPVLDLMEKKGLSIAVALTPK